MKSAIVTFKDHDVKISTWDLCKNMNMDHRRCKTLVSRYKSEFEELGKIGDVFEKDSLPLEGNESLEKNTKKTFSRGGQIKEIWLNEPQAMYLLTLFQNNEKVRTFKMWLSKEFFKQRKALYLLAINKKNAEWLSKRREGKLERVLETDTIKEFVEYCKQQGSKNAEKYYMIITKMENKALFHLDFLEQKFPNVRDVVNLNCLDNLKMADRIVAKALREGMGRKLPYKEVFQLAKERVETFASAIGPTPLHLAIGDLEAKRLEICA